MRAMSWGSWKQSTQGLREVSTVVIGGAQAPMRHTMQPTMQPAGMGANGTCIITKPQKSTF